MKNLFLCIMLIMIICALTPEKKSSVVGVWRCTPPLQDGWKGSVVKTWTKTYCTYVGEFYKDTTRFNVYGGGPYTLDGTHAVENIEFNQTKSAIGNKSKMIYEIKGDTLYQYYPADDNWKYDIKTCNIDKYVRIE